MKNTYKLVCVKWVDAFGCSTTWEEIEDVEAHAHYCYSVGWIVKESDDAIVLVPHYSPASELYNVKEQGCGDMTIPKLGIQYILNLKPEEKIKW